MILLLAAILSLGNSPADAQKALQRALQAKDHRAEAVARNAIARATYPDRWGALAQARLALATNRKLNDFAGQASDLATIGAIYQEHGFSTAALPPLSEALKIELRLGLAAEAADTEEVLALALASVGSYEESATHFAKAIEWKKKNQPGSFELARLEVRLGALETNLGRYELAAEHLGGALDILDRFRARFSQEQWSQLRRIAVPYGARMLKNFGQVPEPTTNPDFALVAARRAVALEEQNKVTPDETTLPIEVRPPPPPPGKRTLDLLDSAVAKKKWAALIEEHARTLTTYENPQMTPETAKALYQGNPQSVVEWITLNAGIFNRREQETRGADAPSPSCLAEEARQINALLRKSGYPPSVTPAMILAESVDEETKSEEEEFDEGFEQIEQILLAQLAMVGEVRAAVRKDALKIVKREDVDSIDDFLAAAPCEAQAAGSLVRIHTFLGNDREAASMKERAWALTFEQTTQQEQVFSSAGIGTLADVSARYHSAKQLGIGAPPSMGGGCEGIRLLNRDALWSADLSVLEGHIPQAIGEYQAAADRESSLRPAALTGLASLYERSGDKLKAVATYREAIGAVEAVQSHLRLDQLVASWSSSQAPLYARLIGLLVQLGQPEAAFEYAERARARTFLNQLGNRRLPAAAAPPDLASEIQTVRRQLIELESDRMRKKGQIEEMLAARGRSRAMEEEDARRRYGELRGRLAQANPAYASLVQVDTASLRQLQREILPPRTTLIEYFVLEDRTLAWVIDRDRMQLTELKLPRRELNDSVNHLRQLIAGREPAAQDVAGRLYAALVAPLRRLIRYPNLIVVPHDALHLLPFPALWDASRKRYLLEDYTLTIAPSASALRFILTKRSAFASGLFAFGNPDYSLPHAEQEAKSVAALFGGSALLGKEAREARLRQEISHAGILHLAAHTRYDAERPLFTSIELAPDAGSAARDEPSDGHLHLYEIYDLDLRATRLVVLSACDTALGPRDDGDDLTALTRAFLYAGVPTVVTTLWSIDDPASAGLMETFYQRLHEGATPSAALRAAQLDVLRRPDWRHPYYWAAFTMTGNPND